ncbi:MAG: GNAT family N-acetyltransferase, partial [Clostridia bacterium]|nr:GNAT family N-acetyltransferase [Clostridia bacterium]
MKLRIATIDDGAALAAIYAYYVENTAITFEYVAPSADEFGDR